MGESANDRLNLRFPLCRNLPAGALSTQRVLPVMLEVRELTAVLTFAFNYPSPKLNKILICPSQLFQKYDTNGNGKLSADELRALVTDMVSEGYTLHSEVGLLRFFPRYMHALR